MPFTRPSSGGSAQSDEAGQQGSQKNSEDATVQRMGQSLQQRRRSSVSSEPRSVGDAGGSLSGLIRPERRPSLQFCARGSTFVRKEGFLTTDEGAVSEGQRTSPRPPVSPCGLLSRQFSSDTLQPPAREAAQDVKVRLLLARLRGTSPPLWLGRCMPISRSSAKLSISRPCRNAWRRATRGHPQRSRRAKLTPPMFCEPFRCAN